MNDIFARLSYVLCLLLLICMCIAIQYEFNRTQDKIDTLTEEVHQLKCSVDSLENYLCD